ncbi:MAG: PD-(D/E)XK motif protein [Alphaproteobacteria bacterium]|nr:PD-(D/E)XK motif protein [Alphaproteobacteria bacterium]
MVHQNEQCDLLSAWRALDSQKETEGWRTIAVFGSEFVKVLAGRHFPGNGETILVGFPSIHVLSEIGLPEAHGFKTEKITTDIDDRFVSWVGLTRQEEGDLDLFAIMAFDIIHLLKESRQSSEKDLFRVFISRILAWQNFMKRGKHRILSEEEETGLYGELTVLETLLSDEMFFGTSVEKWDGPLEGIHDFNFGDWAIEVKSTLANGNGFPAHIGGMDQLDTQSLRSLFLLGLRLRLASSGMNLPDKAKLIRKKICSLGMLPDAYDSRLISAGLAENDYEKYTRKFELVDTRYYNVVDDFPRLVRRNVRSEIRSLRYQLDLDMVPHTGNSIEQLLESIKGMKNES